MQIALIASATGFVSICYPFLALILYLLQKYYLRTSKQIRLLDLEAKSPLYSRCVDTVGGLVTIRAFGWQDKVLKDSHRLLDASQRPYYHMFCIQRWLILVLDLTVAGLALVVMGIAVGMRERARQTSIGVALVNITTLGETLRNLIISWTALETSIAAISRLHTFSRDTPCEPLLIGGVKPNAEWPSCGAIDFKDVSVSYKSVHLTFVTKLFPRFLTPYTSQRQRQTCPPKPLLFHICRRKGCSMRPQWQVRSILPLTLYDLPSTLYDQTHLPHLYNLIPFSLSTAANPPSSPLSAPSPILIPAPSQSMPTTSPPSVAPQSAHASISSPKTHTSSLAPFERIWTLETDIPIS